MANKTVGYSFWNYISDIERDTPGGGNFYIPDLVAELTKRGYRVVPMQENRDGNLSAKKNIPIIFGENFIPEKRLKCYETLFCNSEGVPNKDFVQDCCLPTFPVLDLLIVEWRWPIQGRNTDADRNSAGFTPDLLRQNRLLNHYKDRPETTIVILDLDHKMTEDDELRYPNAHIFETSVSPVSHVTVRTRAFLPFDVEEIFKHKVYLKDNNYSIAYIGNNYEREGAIHAFIAPISKKLPGEVRFIGNWDKYSKEFARITKDWPNISYLPRVTKDEFIYHYGPALTCPILAKESYYECGFITPRILEALMYGCLPVGFTCHRGIENFLPPKLIVSDWKEYYELILELKRMTIHEYKQLLDSCIPYLDMYSPRHYVDKLLSVMGTTPRKVNDAISF